MAKPLCKKDKLIPECPPKPEIELKGGADYYLTALSSRERYKATYDLLLGDG